MAADTSQIAGMIEPDRAEAMGVKVGRLHEHMFFRENPVIYSSPRVLLIKDENAPYGIMVDRPEEIASVPLDFIRPLPPLFEPYAGSKAVWGAVVKDDGVVLIIDFYKLPSSKT
jgi:chemotaxis signal transduction protein